MSSSPPTKTKTTVLWARMTFAKLEDGGSGTSSRRPRVEASLHLVCNACPVLTTMLPGIEPELWPQKKQKQKLSCFKNNPKTTTINNQEKPRVAHWLWHCNALALLQLCHTTSPLGLFQTCSTCLPGATPTLGTYKWYNNQSIWCTFSLKGVVVTYNL